MGLDPGRAADQSVTCEPQFPHLKNRNVRVDPLQACGWRGHEMMYVRCSVLTSARWTAVIVTINLNPQNLACRKSFAGRGWKMSAWTR